MTGAPEEREPFDLLAGQVGARLVAEGDRAQFGNAAWRRELAVWMRSRRRGDGLTVPPMTGAATRFVVAHLDVGGRTARTDQRLTQEAPAVAVLATSGDDVRGWMQAGQALQRALLTAAASGVQAGYSNRRARSRHCAPVCGRRCT